LSNEQLDDVRKIFAQMNWDAGKINDERLSAYLFSNLRGEYAYYLNPDDGKRGKGLIPLDIKRLEDHPGI
jgi:hypothetical protein